MDLAPQEWLEDRLLGVDIDDAVEILHRMDIRYRLSIDGEVSLLTADFVYDRINLHADKQGKIYRIHRG